MNFASRTYILMVFGILTSIPFGLSISKKQCNWFFDRVPGDPTRSLCSDNVNTQSFPNENCKPNIDPKRPPAASICMSATPQRAPLQNGNCPTYKAFGDYKKNKVRTYRCALMTSQGIGKDGNPNGQDRYGKYDCEVLTNIISCTGNGKLETSNVPNFTEAN
ncbi:secreted protein [Melampsora americana]|nr:secreted protein [Melampsora americana]